MLPWNILLYGQGIGPLRALFQDPPSGRGARHAGLPKIFAEEGKNPG